MTFDATIPEVDPASERCPECGSPLVVEPIAAEVEQGESTLTVAYSCPVHGAVALVDPV